MREEGKARGLSISPKKEDSLVLEGVLNFPFATAETIFRGGKLIFLGTTFKSFLRQKHFLRGGDFVSLHLPPSLLTTKKIRTNNMERSVKDPNTSKRKRKRGRRTFSLLFGIQIGTSLTLSLSLFPSHLSTLPPPSPPPPPPPPQVLRKKIRAGRKEVQTRGQGGIREQFSHLPFIIQISSLLFYFLTGRKAERERVNERGKGGSRRKIWEIMLAEKNSQPCVLFFTVRFAV